MNNYRDYIQTENNRREVCTGAIHIEAQAADGVCIPHPSTQGSLQTLDTAQGRHTLQNTLKSVHVGATSENLWKMHIMKIYRTSKNI